MLYAAVFFLQFFSHEYKIIAQNDCVSRNNSNNNNNNNTRFAVDPHGGTGVVDFLVSFLVVGARVHIIHTFIGSVLTRGNERARATPGTGVIRSHGTVLLSVAQRGQ
jgi:hypothetical protein